jgi:hypothetical protein
MAERIAILDHCSEWEAMQDGMRERKPQSRERAMKLNSMQIKRTLHQFNADAIPEEHPAIAKLERLFGDHTYFLDKNGLNIVEPVEAEQTDGRKGVVINLASWTDESAASLQPHEPEPTDLVVDLEADTRH